MYYPITPQTLKYPNTQYLKYSKYQKLKKKKTQMGESLPYSEDIHKRRKERPHILILSQRKV